MFKSLLIFLFLFNYSSVFASTMLMITDSHGEGTFGSEMVHLAESNGSSISVYAVGGTNAIDWVNGLQAKWGYWEHHTGHQDIRSMAQVTPRLEELVKKHNPDAVLVELGTNQIWNEFTAADKADILKIVSIINDSGAKCYWVGPPDLRLSEDYLVKFKQVKEMLTNELPQKNCQIFKSWEFTHYPALGGDGIHYDGELKEIAANWARATYHWAFSILPLTHSSN